VAIKILEKDKIKDQSDIDRINREITILKKVRHPHVV
jgi:5'-AMP-activated protein kinase catalytic alpha subunit